MTKKKIFISYDYDNDKRYKNLLVAWDKNNLFDFSFYDASIDVSVNSEDADYIKRVIKDRINSTSHFLCIIGRQTYKSGWVEWEINTASNLYRKIIAAKTEQSNTSPNEISDIAASWAKSFTFESIKNAIEEA